MDNLKNWNHIVCDFKVSKYIAMVGLLVNFFLPGVGTWLIWIFHFNKIEKEEWIAFLAIGFLQSLTAIIIIGWLYAIYTSVMQLSFWRN